MNAGGVPQQEHQQVVGEEEGVVGHGGHGEGERETERLSNVSRK